jgi:hypothetical protein
VELKLCNAEIANLVFEALIKTQIAKNSFCLKRELCLAFAKMFITKRLINYSTLLAQIINRKLCE